MLGIGGCCGTCFCLGVMIYPLVWQPYGGGCVGQGISMRGSTAGSKVGNALGCGRHMDRCCTIRTQPRIIGTRAATAGVRWLPRCCATVLWSDPHWAASLPRGPLAWMCAIVHSVAYSPSSLRLPGGCTKSYSPGMHRPAAQREVLWLAAIGIATYASSRQQDCFSYSFSIFYGSPDCCSGGPLVTTH